MMPTISGERDREREREREEEEGLLAKMEAKVDTLCLLPQPKEGQQQF